MKCSNCEGIINSFADFRAHVVSNHRNDAPFNILCPECNLLSANYGSWKSHLTRFHTTLPAAKKIAVSVEMLQCKYEKCNYSTRLIENFLKHHRDHCTPSHPMVCPCVDIDKSECTKRYTISHSFQSHMDRCHKSSFINIDYIKKEYRRKQVQPVDVDPLIQCVPSTSSDETFMETDDEVRADVSSSRFLGDTIMSFEEFEKSVAKFMLLLQSVDFVPVTTIDSIVSEFCCLYKSSLAITCKKIKDSLDENDFGEASNAIAIIKDATKNDVFLKCFDKKGSLSTNYFRMKYYKNKMNFVEPSQVHLYTDEKKKSIIIIFISQVR